jgi:pimeloyl-ACP methyl ester carboxylesterase
MHPGPCDFTDDARIADASHWQFATSNKEHAAMGTLDRRDFLRGASAALAVTATQFGLASVAHAHSFRRPISNSSGPFGSESTDDGEIFMSASSTNEPGPQGPGSVSQVPNLPDGFSDTFTSQYVDAGALRLHAVTGGDGPPLLLVHGWPQTWYAWRLVMPTLARDFQVIAVDQRGIGLSDRPDDGYDTGTMANDLVALMDALGHQRFAMVGHDTGMWIGYALAADHPERLDRLAVAETPIPGLSPSPPLLSSARLNAQLFHFGFNWLDGLNEQLITGREDIYFGFQFATKAAKQLPDYAVKYYVDTLAAAPEALHASFAMYRDLDATIAQNGQRKTQPVSLPVLAIGGGHSLGQQVADSMKLGAEDVQGLVIPGCAHYPAEETPEDLLAALSAFLAPYRGAPSPLVAQS